MDDDALSVYLREIGQVPPLSREEEIECIRHVRTGDQAAESAEVRLVEAHLRLVVSIAERYQNDRVHILDLIQKGNEGLLRAVRTLSEHGCGSFSDHAAGHIERAIADAI